MHRYYQQAITGFETFAVGAFLEFQKNMYHDDPGDRLVHLAYHVHDLWWSGLLMVVGLIVIIFSLMKGRYQVHYWLNLLLGACWMSYLVFFFIQDVHFGPGIHLGTILSAFVLVRIFTDAYSSERRRR